MIKVGIIGASGYTGGELLRLLANHPEAEITFAYSTTFAGKAIGSIHQDLIGANLGSFTDVVQADADVIFLCLGHGKSKEFLNSHAFSDATKIINLGNDFRLSKDADGFIYGLPELNRNKIKASGKIANPGCFATAIQLALLPLADKNLLNLDVHINATTGSTGAGVSLSETSHHPWRMGNMSHYKAFSHQHLDEINQSLKSLQPDFEAELLFIPNRGDFTRGIFATLYTKCDIDFSEVEKLYKDFYETEPFVYVTTEAISLKSAIQTNNCIISIEQKGNYLLITSVIDNLIKGASGQAMQNMNLMFGLDETIGLKLKATGF
ncbi:N-acetyl-gamma-glutamyl-phosphate reductase [Flavobacterium silvaticum]|uniref:N-acetyl-gamma-glutamyl-phosphate reductase n=1 Tax=Flavobacterium silvaticum TaxID=1852020 RepID=A0A972FRJ6_9FLAO|nr:N-acetyl-gamma-glutamyl-phosphate reductase [Flavobacterium silvaticum]NMH27188.1 N-acetyl-gamma-glutamyl-phosphate reductase [Flavobacterium silvaticum]